MNRPEVRSSPDLHRRAPLREVPVLDARHHQRVQRILWVAIVLVGGYGLLFGLFFAWRGLLAPLVLDGVSLGTAVWAGLLMRQRRPRLAARLLVGVMTVVLTLNAAFLDVPTVSLPRSSHHFLLALGVVAALVLRDEPSLLRHGAPALCLTAFGMLAVLPTPVDALAFSVWAVPPDVRRVGIWVNVSLALFTIWLVLRLLLQDVRERNALERELLQALVNDELRMHLQPQVDDRGCITGAEALVRWAHPQRGLVMPADFVPVAERSGLAEALGERVRHEACQLLGQWARDPQLAGLTLAVNVSAAELAREDFCPGLERLLARWQVPAGRLKLELTESVLAGDLERVAAQMARLQALGVGLALDDFGTGFSSLNYLRRLPLEQLKLDQVFVRQLAQSPQDVAIARAVIGLGQSLSLTVVAEGVETAAQRQLLAELGCRCFQGHLFSPALAVDAFEALVRTAPRGGLAAA
ncbi:putative bifunctional diguanylate cyclase/phosphodiesterase [Ideonella livida]|uniref:EAL domain-containing protein n=1 Tax=Ideonella livida TaxID=2707176 RepID=A0A7C9TK90_9BURK|nr:EAL domain-containing protein [Ideonella livida]NDY91682.1 EAL domain-containing protein [Ideonella livida]